MYKLEFERWLDKVTDKDLLDELNQIRDDESAIEDRFYRDLEFGTGGLRGVIGAGINRMNIHTVAKASQGLADYVNKTCNNGEKSIAISYDSRIKSELFSKVAAGVFAANGIVAHIYNELMPTPCLSFAVRALKCSAGIMITASHNPAKYNGYKVYGPDGCQITTEAAKLILAEIDKLDIFADIKTIPFDEGVSKGLISYIDETVYTNFIEEVKGQSVLFGDEIDKNVSIVYSPLNGTGLKPVLRALKESGYSNITVVKEQEKPDGNFTTCPYPNPEIKEAMELGMRYAKESSADLLLATDPDCDRVGIAVKNTDGEYQLLSGNQTGLLLLDYICSQRKKHDKMPENPVVIKTIVTMDLADKIAAFYGANTINVLTGFKFIGEQIGFLEEKGRESDYIFGFEESYGYLSGGYVRDKDAVNGAYLICEMFAYYKTRGVNLIEKLQDIFDKFGYCMNTLHSYTFEGSSGFEKMQKIMESFRTGISTIAGIEIEKNVDYSAGVDGLPKSNVLKYFLCGGHTVVVRPSGTEPKLKLYISVNEKDEAAAVETEKKIVCALEEKLN